jgi:hypothetical protein
MVEIFYSRPDPDQPEHITALQRRRDEAKHAWYSAACGEYRQTGVACLATLRASHEWQSCSHLAAAYTAAEKAFQAEFGPWCHAQFRAAGIPGY